MGCDIHLMCEKKNQYDDRWVNCDRFCVNPCWHDQDDDGYERKFDCLPIYDDRNYETFSFLSGVRNYGGNECFWPLRGFPDDAHEVTKEEYESWGEDAHSPGFCTLEELKGKAAGVKIVHRKGMVSNAAYEEYKHSGKTPEMWCQWTSQEGWKYLEWDDECECFDELLEAMQIRKEEVFGISYDRSEDDDKFRIVFWFDN